MPAQAHTTNDSTTIPGPAAQVPVRRGDVRRTVGAAVIAGLAIASLLVASQTTQEEATPVTSTVERGVPVDETEALRRLVARGYVPAEAYDAEAEATRRLTRRGLVPPGTRP